jgi:hypothetical protein
MRVPLVIKCSLVIGSVLALVACIDNGSLDSGDVRSG